jgi:hypothetical protein
MPEKTLRHILGVLVGKTGKTREIVKRIPVARTELRQAAVVLGRVHVPRMKNEIPLGSAKMRTPFLADALFRFHEDARSTSACTGSGIWRQTQSGIADTLFAKRRRLEERRLQYFFEKFESREGTGSTGSSE